VIRRRLSVPPEQRIVRLPHTVGQVRLVGVPEVGGCCIWDTFTAPDGTLLSDHKPDVGGPWVVQRAPIIEAGQAFGLGGEGGGWATAWANCGPAVRIEASWSVYGIQYDVAAVMLWWSGARAAAGRGGEDGISLVIYEYSGLYCQVRYPSVANPLVMQVTEPIRILPEGGPYQMRLEMRGTVAHWAVSGREWSAKGAVVTGAGPRPGVGWLSDGYNFQGTSYAAGVDEFRACPL